MRTRQAGSVVESDIRSVEDEQPIILLAEDDREMRDLLVSVLRSSGRQVLAVSNGVDLLAEIDGRMPPRPGRTLGLVISDIRMPGLTGLDVMAGLRQDPGFPPMILITAFGDDETHQTAARLGAVATLDKPFPLEDLMALVDRILPAGRAKN